MLEDFSARSEEEAFHLGSCGLIRVLGWEEKVTEIVA